MAKITHKIRLKTSFSYFDIRRSRQFLTDTLATDSSFRTHDNTKKERLPAFTQKTALSFLYNIPL